MPATALQKTDGIPPRKWQLARLLGWHRACSSADVPMSTTRLPHLVLSLWPAALAACGGAGDTPPECTDGREPFRQTLVCASEFEGQAASPLDSSLPGATTVKTIIDRAADSALYFIDTQAYPLHSTFAREHLGYPPGAPFTDEYFLPSRRLVLGAVTYYEEPDVWAYELAPYDTANAEMIADAYTRLAAATFFGAELRFHPTSEEQLAVADSLPPEVQVITTDQLYAGITYQPLNLGETYARVHVLDAADLEDTYVGPREIAVLDEVPNDLSVVAGVVTGTFQTPLSHVNVLSQQRGTPNMALVGAQETLAPYDGTWVRLTVGAFAWEVEEVTAEQAEAWWQDHRPEPAVVPPPDFAVTGILDVDDVGPDDVAAVGGKAANYGELRRIGPPVNVQPGLVIPLVHYHDFLVATGLDLEIEAMLADEDFQNDGVARADMLEELRATIQATPLDPDFLAMVEARLEADFPSTRMKFRSSTNAEDLEHHTGAGLYESAGGQVGDPIDTVENAIRAVWASVWNFRAFEEREYVSIVHLDVNMAVLVVPSFQDEDANGVAITANIYDPAPGGEDALTINAQKGEVSVVQPPAGITVDSMLYYHFHNGQPATYYTRSNLVPAGQHVLTRAQLFALGQALAAVRTHFGDFYDPPAGYGALPMDVEWKLTGDEIWIKQARPYPGRGTP
jgi:hypothetical protein